MFVNSWSKQSLQLFLPWLRGSSDGFIYDTQILTRWWSWISYPWFSSLLYWLFSRKLFSAMWSLSLLKLFIRICVNVKTSHMLKRLIQKCPLAHSTTTYHHHPPPPPPSAAATTSICRRHHHPLPPPPPPSAAATTLCCCRHHPPPPFIKSNLFFCSKSISLDYSSENRCSTKKIKWCC